MGKIVCMGAMISCAFGAAPTPLSVDSNQKVFTNTPVATIKDNVVGKNVTPFGTCVCPGRPGVIRSYGTVPQPCSPIIAGPWTPGSTVVMVGGTPALIDTCKLMCSYGGIISVSNAGQFKTDVSR